MPMGVSNLEELIALRKQERAEEQLAYTRDMARQADEALGPRVTGAIDPDHAGWDVNHATATRRFRHHGGEFHLVLSAIQGAPRVELELRHVDPRFGPLAKKPGPGGLDEDWFLNAIETLSTQIQERLTSPKNFA